MAQVPQNPTDSFAESPFNKYWRRSNERLIEHGMKPLPFGKARRFYEIEHSDLNSLVEQYRHAIVKSDPEPIKKLAREITYQAFLCGYDAEGYVSELHDAARKALAA